MTAEAAIDEMVEGYRDGFRDTRDEFPAHTNRPPTYRHGWLNGRDDRLRQPRASSAELADIAAHLLGETR